MVFYVWSPVYHVDIGPHVFPTDKYRRIIDRLRAEDGLEELCLRIPGQAPARDLVRVHDPGYYERCRNGTLGAREVLKLELPWSPALFEASATCVQGSILAAADALDHGVGLHVGGGFHHAYPDHGEGFCVFNDHAVALRWAQAERGVRRAAVIDTDVHHGNGTAAIFASDPSVSTYSIHQDGIYPLDRPPSTVDVGLPAGTGDSEYLDMLENSVGPFLDEARPELIAYVAGADPYGEDQLGGLTLSLDGLRRRDQVVIEACASRSIPLFVVLAGGYARRVEDTVQIHLTTLRLARQAWRREGASAGSTSGTEGTAGPLDG